MTGTVKKKTDKGFGFISAAGEEKDLFFHSSALVGISFDALQEGATVTFDVENDQTGRQRAKNVKLAGQDSASAPAEESAPVAEDEQA